MRQKTTTAYKDGQKYALCAISFFRARHGQKPRYKNATRKRNAIETVPVYQESVRMSRHFIALARKHGFKGFVYQGGAA